MPSAPSSSSTAAGSPVSSSAGLDAGVGRGPSRARPAAVGVRAGGLDPDGELGSSARTVPAPTRTASEAARSRWTSARASSPVIQLRRAVGGGDPAVEGGGQLEHHPGASRCAGASGRGPAARPPPPAPTPTSTSTPGSRSSPTPRPDTWGSGSIRRHHHPGHPGGQRWPRARRGAAVVGTRLEGRVEGGAACPVPGVGQGHHLGMRAPREARWPPRTTARPRHHAPHPGVGRGAGPDRRPPAPGPGAWRRGPRPARPARAAGSRPCHGTHESIGAPGRAFSPALRIRCAASHGRSSPKIADPATSTRAPARTTAGAVSSSMPPSTSRSAPRPRRSSSSRVARDLGEDLGDERLATEPGVHRHAQDEVDLRQEGLDGLERRLGIDGQPRAQPQDLAWASRAAVSPTSTCTVHPSAPACRNASR